MRNMNYFLRILARWAAITLSISALVFVAAGTSQLRCLRNYLVVYSTFLLATMLAIDPGLVWERSCASGLKEDKGRATAGLLFLGTLIVGAFETGRLRWFEAVPATLQICGLTIFAIAEGLQLWAMIANPFFSPNIRIQSEQGHCVVRGGPYRFVRHPGYLAMLISIPASAIAIGSWLALVPSAMFGLLILERVRIEDGFLESNLAGYREYMQMVPGGLVPRPMYRRRFCEDLDDRNFISRHSGRRKP